MKTQVLDRIKKLLKIIAVLFIGLLMSCSEDFIDLKPTDTVSVAQLYLTDGDFNDAVQGCYAGLNDVYTSFWWFGDLRGDDSYDELQKGHAPFENP